MIRTETHPTAHGPVGLLILDRPDRRNALTPGMERELKGGAERLGASCRVVVVRGQGKVFCAGFDLSLCKDSPDGTVMRELLVGLSEFVVTLRELPVPVVIAVNGAAIAGGCAILGGADFVVTHDDAQLGYPVVKLGVSPAVSAPFLRQTIGDGPTRERMLDTPLISGRTAAKIGLAWTSRPSADEVLPAAMSLAQRLAEKPPAALAATRRWLAEIENLADSPGRALDASLSLTGGEEERRLLPRVWAR